MHIHRAHKLLPIRANRLGEISEEMEYIRMLAYGHRAYVKSPKPEPESPKNDKLDYLFAIIRCNRFIGYIFGFRINFRFEKYSQMTDFKKTTVVDPYLIGPFSIFTRKLKFGFRWLARFIRTINITLTPTPTILSHSFTEGEQSRLQLNNWHGHGHCVANFHATCKHQRDFVMVTPSLFCRTQQILKGAMKLVGNIFIFFGSPTKWLKWPKIQINAFSAIFASKDSVRHTSTDFGDYAATTFVLPFFLCWKWKTAWVECWIFLLEIQLIDKETESDGGSAIDISPAALPTFIVWKWIFVCRRI